MKWLIMFVLIIFCIGFVSSAISVSADTYSFGIFEEGKQIELIQTCNNDTSFCDGCNITSIKYPNSSIILSNLEMTKRTSDFNYTLDGSYTEILGEYLVNGYCWTASETDGWSYTLKITTTGRSSITTGEGIVFIASLLAMLFFSLLFFLISNSFKVEKEYNNEGELIMQKGNSVFRFGCLALSIVGLLLFILYCSVSLSQMMDGFDFLKESYQIFFYIFLAILLVIFIFVLLVILFSVVERFYRMRGLKT